MEKEIENLNTIMKKSILLILICALSAIFSFAQKETGTKTAANSSDYRQMVAKVRSGDPSVNFGELRRAYVEWLNDGVGDKEAPNRDEMVKAFDAKDYAKAVQLGEIVADYEFVNSGLLNAIGDAYEKLGNADKVKFYRELSLKARHSLYLSGDGKTTKTAYYVINIDEEYKVMRGLGYAVSSQALLSSDGASYDMLSGKDESGKPVSLYFNICAFFPCAKR